jgi:hypothetical protein
MAAASSNLTNRESLELLRQLDVDEASNVIVDSSRKIVGIAGRECAKLFRRVLTKDVVATDGNGCVIQEILPTGQEALAVWPVSTALPSFPRTISFASLE